MSSLQRSTSEHSALSRSSIRKARLAAAEREEMLEDMKALKMTPEQQHILEQSFVSVKCNLWDLDGLSWTTSMRDSTKRSTSQVFPIVNTCRSPTRLPLPSSFTKRSAPTLARKVTPYPHADSVSPTPSPASTIGRSAVPSVFSCADSEPLSCVDDSLDPTSSAFKTIRPKNHLNPAKVFTRPACLTSLFSSRSPPATPALDSTGTVDDILRSPACAQLDTMTSRKLENPQGLLVASDSDGVISRWDSVQLTVRKRTDPSPSMRGRKAATRQLEDAIFKDTLTFNLSTSASPTPFALETGLVRSVSGLGLVGI